MGMPIAIATLLLHMTANALRFFQYNGTIGSLFSARNGIWQGCPISLILVICLLTVWAALIDETLPGSMPSAFVDDRSILVETLPQLLKAMKMTLEFEQSNLEKSNVLAQNVQIAESLRDFFLTNGITMQVSTNIKLVGHSLDADYATNHTLATKRRDAASAMIHRIGQSPLKAADKISITIQHAIPIATLASEHCSWNRARFASLHWCFIAAIWKDRPRRFTSIEAAMLVVLPTALDVEFTAIWHSTQWARRIALTDPIAMNALTDTWSIIQPYSAKGPRRTGAPHTSQTSARSPN